MGYNSRKIKDRAIELEEGYEEAYNEAFNDEFRDAFQKELGGQDVITKDDIQGFIDSFTFPDSMTWAFDQVQAELDDIADQKHEEERDRKMGL